MRGEAAYIDADTYVGASSVETAELAAGGTVAMVDALIDGPVKRGIALVRPPGHHARPGQAMGFCLLNNVAIAAAHARARGIERVAVVDWDVHHGNGTQEAFYRDPHVLYVSTHQFPFYPGTGAVLRGSRASKVSDCPQPGRNPPLPPATVEYLPHHVARPRQETRESRPVLPVRRS
jgi:acetoin utilization deacetylase AcuC-like enzyme